MTAPQVPPASDRRRRYLLIGILAVALLVLGSCVGILASRGGGKAKGNVTITGVIKVLGCGPGRVQVAARPIVVTKSNLGSPKPLERNPSTTVPTISNSVSVSPSSSGSPSTPASTPASTPVSSPSTSLSGVILLPSSSTSGVAYERPLVQARPVVHGAASSGTYKLTGLFKGQLYQLGAKVAGCPTGKVDVPNAGLFLAGGSAAPNLGVIAPPQVKKPTTPGGDVPWSLGPGLSGGTYQVSAGDAPHTCGEAPKGVIASGTLTGTNGTLHLDNPALARAVHRVEKNQLVAGVPYAGNLHLRLVPAVAKGDPCAPSVSIDVPVSLADLPQAGATQLQVYNHFELVKAGYGNCEVCQAGPYDPSFWGTTTAVDWLNPAESSRPFDWSSTAPGTTGGIWQLSSTVLPDTCMPSGLIDSGPVGFAAGPLTKDGVTVPPLFTLDLHNVATQLNTASTYYLRVVPTDAKGNCTGPASTPVTLTYKATPQPGCLCLAQPNPPPKLADVHTLVTSFQPLTGASPNPPYCFQALTDHTVTTDLTGLTQDFVGWAAVGPGGSISKGTSVCLTPQSDGDSSFWDDVTSIVDVIVDIVSFPAKVYDLYEQIIPGILGDLIPGCGDTCKNDLLIAEKVALTAVGLPPSLPDASRIVNEGEDYLVDQAAEATPIPASVIRAGYDAGKAEIISKLAEASSNQTGFSCDWCAFDNGVRAPTVSVFVFRSANDDPTLPLPDRICVDNSESHLSQPSADYLANPLYYGSCAQLPKNFPPGATLTIPLSLTANTAAIRWKIYGDFAAQNSQIVESDGDLDELAFESWLGQQQHTPFVKFTSSAVTMYDAGTGFGMRQATTGPYTGVFPE